jgi:hypothetical protein
MIVNRILTKDKKVGYSIILSQVAKYSAGRTNVVLTSAQPSHYDDIDAKTSWQAQHNVDIQRVTQKAIVRILDFVLQ